MGLRKRENKDKNVKFYVDFRETHCSFILSMKAWEELVSFYKRITAAEIQFRDSMNKMITVKTTIGGKFIQVYFIFRSKFLRSVEIVIESMKGVFETRLLYIFTEVGIPFFPTIRSYKKYIDSELG